MSGDSDAEFDLIRVESLESKVLRFRRERIATAVLAGMLANPARCVGKVEGLTANEFEAMTARVACGFADALIAELDKEK